MKDLTSRIETAQWYIERKEAEAKRTKKEIECLLDGLDSDFDCDAAERICRESATLLKAVTELNSLQTQKRLLLVLAAEKDFNEYWQDCIREGAKII